MNEEYYTNGYFIISIVQSLYKVQFQRLKFDYENNNYMKYDNTEVIGMGSKVRNIRNYNQ